MKISEMIVVEGRDDTVAIQRSVEADTIETGGSAINKEKLERIRLAQARRGVIIFTDPDYPGERIRKIIEQNVPGCKHAFLPREKARSSKGKYGIEHAQPEDIQEALRRVKRTEIEHAEHQQEFTLSMVELQALGLVGAPDSQALRESLSKIIGIGYCNGKQLAKRIQAFRIQHEEFEQAYNQAIKEVRGID